MPAAPLLPITGKTRLIGVMGWPVEHTKSPPMQNAALRAAGIEAAYVPLAVAPDRVAEAVRGLRALGFVGSNVTVPHKVAVMEHLDELTVQARAVGAVNTIRVEKDGRLTGHNTDCFGVTRALEADGTSLAGKTVAVIGAGGAGRGAAVGAASAKAARVVILNRTLSKAIELAQDLAQRADFGDTEFSAAELAGYGGWESADVVLQMTSLGMHGEGTVPCPLDRLPAHAHVLEAVYAPLDTAFLASARARGLKGTDGLAMLLWQGAEAFRFWFGIDPDTSVMRAALVDAMGLTQEGSPA